MDKSTANLSAKSFVDLLFDLVVGPFVALFFKPHFKYGRKYEITTYYLDSSNKASNNFNDRVAPEN